MKKLLFILTIALFSCEKDTGYCWTCYRETVGPGFRSSVEITICDLSEEEIGSFMRVNTFEKNNVKYSMRCNKQ